jgi:broad specificity phosphatase PhoE
MTKPRFIWGLISILALFLPAGLIRATPTTTAAPKVIYIIRHAEKPDGGDDPDLSPKGYERAAALANVIPDHFSVPDMIFAAAKSKHSDRPVETVTPLAQNLHLSIQDNVSDKDYADLAHALLTDPRYTGKTILICWHHEEIPDLAQALGADAPKKWSSDVFDRVWELTFDQGHVVFQNLPEKALPGD